MERGGRLEQVDPDEVGIGSVIVVQPGEKVPIDGIIVQNALEGLTQDVIANDEVIHQIQAKSHPASCGREPAAISAI